jgi:4-alpha-glucanotransferase
LLFARRKMALKYPLVSRNTIVYTGTHENDTSRSWFETLARQDRDWRRTLLAYGSGAGRRRRSG